MKRFIQVLLALECVLVKTGKSPAEDRGAKKMKYAGRTVMEKLHASTRVGSNHDGVICFLEKKVMMKFYNKNVSHYIQ